MKRIVLSLTAALLSLSLGLVAQTTDAVLSGSVLDPSGAALPTAGVAAENVKTGVVYRTVANESGVYLYPALPPGVYRVTAEVKGFRRLIYNDVVLEVGGRLTLNLELELGTLAESVEVRAEMESALGYATSSVGGVVSGQKVTDLPLTARNALGLVYIHAGVVGDNFSGARLGSLNINLDGINIQDNRINLGVTSPIFTSVDRIEEFRVVTSPADVEYGRGSGQIQMISRSGTNEFHGSVFEFHRNTKLNANTWFNNQRGINPATGEPFSPRNFLIRNQFGARLGGPLIRNRTFFHALYEGQRIRTKDSVSSTTYTEQVRRGIFRFYPGVQNGNANAAVPTVDLMGNPVRPAEATGDLQSVSLFGRDPNRMVADPTGTIQKMLQLMPLPNNFRGGDGLNTALYTWILSGSQDFDQVNIKLDHHFNDKHRASYSFTYEPSYNRNAFMPQPFPEAPGGDSRGRDTLNSLSVVSTLRPNLLNEFRVGALRPKLRFNAPWEVAGTDILPKSGTHPYLIDFTTVTDPLNLANDPQGRITPIYQFGNDITWLKGKHSFKGGIITRFRSTNGFNSFDVMPRATIGAGGQAVQNIGAIAGIGRNQTTAQNVLLELVGSLSNNIQAFNSPGGATPDFLAGEPKQRTWRNREISFFFKDDYKVSQDLTLNLGVRYEYFSVPYDVNGKAATLAGGSGSIFGITGTTFADMYQPGRNVGSLTRVELVGPGSPNPSRGLHNNDLNNWAPAVGLSWSLPWFGKNKTVFRAGYGIGYELNSLRIYDVVAGDQPGLRERVLFTTGSYLDLSRMRLPLTTIGKPLDLVPLTDRSQTVRVFDTGLRNPYYQNWNASIQRSLPGQLLLDVRYVGNKGTRLARGIDVNERNIFETGILQAFLSAQAGGNSPLLDRIFMGLNIPGLGVVDGVSRTGAQAMRVNSTTQAYLAQNDVATFANYLFTSNQFTGERGGLMRRAGFPDNWIVPNPQFSSARLTSNLASSIYNSLQVEVTRRFVSGFSLQANYTWSRAFGEEEGAGQEMVDSYRDNRNWRLDRRLMSFHRTHVARTSGTWEFPMGPGKRLAGNTSGWVARLVENWQVSYIFNVFSGQPINLTSGVASYNTFGDNTASAAAPLAKNTGNVLRTGNGVVYFDGFRQLDDPYVATLTTDQGIRGRSTLRAIADSSGRIILVNPAPGTLGTLGANLLEGPGDFRLDLNLVKRIRTTERTNLELRADFINASNSPQFDNPNTDINSTNFGRITGAGGTRIIVVGARLNF